MLSSSSSICSKSQSDINAETETLRKKYLDLLKPESLTSSGPNSCPPRAFGGTSKGPATEPLEKNNIDYELKKIENWKKYNEIGQTVPRKRIVQTYGKLLETPGPGDYTPNETVLSTNEPSYKYSLHDRPYYPPPNNSDTPGPGSYDSPSGIQAAFERFRRDPLPEMAPPKSKVGPGSYTPARSVEFGKFPREVCAVMPRRDKGTIRRSTVDPKTLYIHKSSKVQKDSKEFPNSHLGPGTYFHPSEDNIPVSNPSIDLTPTAKKSQWTLTARDTTSPNSSKSIYYDVDPMLPSRSVFTIGERRRDAALISDPCPPGPGSYSPDRSLFGSTLLKEGGGAVTRPGKLCPTTASEGTIPGQHAPAIYSLPTTMSHPKLISKVYVKGSNGETKQLTATWKSSPHLTTGDQKAMANALKSVKRYHNSGRVTESTVTSRDYIFRGKNSSGSYMRFNTIS